MLIIKKDSSCEISALVFVVFVIDAYGKNIFHEFFKRYILGS